MDNLLRAKIQVRIDQEQEGTRKKKKAVNKKYSWGFADYTEQQLIDGAPLSLLEYLLTLNREITLEDLSLVYTEPDGSPNLKIVIDALESLSDSNIPLVVRAEIRVELMMIQRELEMELENESFESFIDTTSLYSAVNKADFNSNSVLDVQTPIQQELSSEVVKELEEAIKGLEESLAVYDENGITGDTTNPYKKTKGAESGDLRGYPDFRALGIDRAAGPATEEEVAYFAGQTRSDGTPVTEEDFFSVGVLLMNNDLLEDRYVQMSGLELGRLGVMLSLKNKGSDTNHEFEVGDAHFRLVNPRIGIDESVAMHKDSALLGKEPYTALTARALFPIMEKDSKQIAAVERVRRGLIQNVSPAWGVRYYTCASCGENKIEQVQKMDGKITALKIKSNNPETINHMNYCGIVIRTPKNVTGGFIYTEAQVMAAEDGILSVDPFNDPGLAAGSVLMIKMDMIPMVFEFAGAKAPRYCQLHGIQGNYGNDGCKVVAMGVDSFAYLSTSEVVCGAFSDARFVLDPETKY